MGYHRDDIFLKNFGKFLKQKRIKCGYTQEELAFKIGVEISQISRLERGVLNCSVSLVHSIAKALDIPTEELFEF